MLANPIKIISRTSNYNVDGTGRDTYINFDNGGNHRGLLIYGHGKF
jgi:hypothetical protein